MFRLGPDEMNINLVMSDGGPIEKYERSRVAPFRRSFVWEANCEMRKERFIALGFLRMYATRGTTPPWETWHELAPKPEKLFRDRGLLVFVGTARRGWRGRRRERKKGKKKRKKWTKERAWMIEGNKLLICLSSDTIERHRNVTQLLAKKRRSWSRNSSIEEYRLPRYSFKRMFLVDRTSRHFYQGNDDGWSLLIKGRR